MKPHHTHLQLFVTQLCTTVRLRAGVDPPLSLALGANSFPEVLRLDARVIVDDGQWFRLGLPEEIPSK